MSGPAFKSESPELELEPSTKLDYGVVLMPPTLIELSVLEVSLLVVEGGPLKLVAW